MIELVLLAVVLLVGMSKQFNGGGQFGNSMSVLRFRLATSYIEFKTSVGVGLGGVKRIGYISPGVSGITTVNDAGGAGLPPMLYNPTINAVGIGSAGINANGVSSDVAGNFFFRASGNAAFVLTNDQIIFYQGSGLTSVIVTPSTGDLRATGWLLAKGVSGSDESEFINIDHAAASAPGVKWLSSEVVASATVAGDGGIRRIQTNSVTPSWWKGVQASYSAAMAYGVYFRFASQEDANSRKAIGYVDEVPAAAPNSLPYTNDAVVCMQDTAVGANYLLRTRVGGAAVVDVDTGIAITVTELHLFDLKVATTKVATLTIDGTLRATSAAADGPLATTKLKKVIYADNIGAAVNSRLDIDFFKPYCSRNTAVTP